jgi:F-type H+-transporting ATPase subunit alpha
MSTTPAYVHDLQHWISLFGSERRGQRLGRPRAGINHLRIKWGHMPNLLQEIELEIAGAKSTPAKQNIGAIREIGDGVAKVEGLTDAMVNEMLDFGSGITGIALDLDETEVGVIVLGDYTKLEEGGEVRTTGKLLQVPVGKGLLGRVVNTLGEPIDGKGPIKSDTFYPVEKLAPGIIRREPVRQPVQTGIVAIDAMIPIGRGQRELIIGDRSTGKTTICIDTIISQARLNKAAEASGDKTYRPLYCIYVAIGQKQSSIARIISTLEEAGAIPYTIIVASPAADSAANQYLVPFAGAAMGEWFMDNGMDAMIVYDDLSKHAVAYRQVSLVLKRPSGREAYPGDVFYLHSRLLERAARVGAKYGNGSLTALPIIETQAGDVSAYIPTNVISITDGQIYLETDLFYQGVRPAISVGLSVSRVGSAAQLKAMKQVAGQLKGDLAQFRELAAFAQFGSELDAKSLAQIDRGKRIMEIFKQAQSNPIPVVIQVAILWAVQNSYMDDVPVDRVKDCQLQLTDFLTTRKPELLNEIGKQGALNDSLNAQLKAAVSQFKEIWK